MREQRPAIVRGSPFEGHGFVGAFLRVKDPDSVVEIVLVKESYRVVDIKTEQES